MEGIILAAGYSKRAKDFKMNLLLGNKTVLEHTLGHFEGYCNRIIIVGGYQIERIQEQMKHFEQYNKYVELVYNENYHEGMFSSIQKGCKALKEDHFLLTPGDYPLIQDTTINALVRCEEEVVVPSYQNKNGHPVKLGYHVKRAILSAEEKDNLRNLLKKFPQKVITVDDPGILMDLDTPNDYTKIKEYYMQRSKGASK